MAKRRAKPFGRKQGPPKKYGSLKKKPRRTGLPADGPRTAVNLPPREDGERLQKVMAAAGIASRRECELLIEEGRVEVDGQVVTELGVRVDPFKQRITFDGEALPKKRRVYFAVNKPDGVVCTARDPSGRTRVTDLLPPNVGRVFNVGRLDMASEGLILLTNDGELANRLTHPRHGVEKVYHVQVAGTPTSETLGQLRKGVYLAEGTAHFVEARIKSKRKNGVVLEVILDEGRNREIRRVLARVGHKVQRLTRVAVGPVKLGELPSSAYRELTQDEVKALRAAASGVAKKESAQRSPKRKGGSSKSTGPRRPSKKSAPRKAKPSEAKPRRVILGDEAEATAPTKKKPAKKRPFKKKAASSKGTHSKTAQKKKGARSKPTTSKQGRGGTRAGKATPGKRPRRNK